ncbi:lamin tail domain-containing protein [Nitrososphaera sp.]|uniref:lamin tail domain-containing protein n=1 Tax=Nitrososphaera sp. TaxID=1971748 RepID=UPI002EDA877A
MLAKTGLVVALVVGLVGAGVVGDLPASAQMNNEKQVVNQSGSGSGKGILINEVEMNPPGRDTGREWVELYNPTSSGIIIGNFAIQTSFQRSTITIPADIVIGAGQFYVVKVEGERFANIVEMLALVNPAGETVDKTPWLPDKLNDALTWQRMPDGSSTWRFIAATPGGPNDPASYQKVSERSLASAGTSAAVAPKCLGLALCIKGKVIRMVDTDTLYVKAGKETYKVDLSLTKVSRSDRTYENGSTITKRLCLGSDVLVDQDDRSVRGKGKNIVAVVYCSSHNLNQELLDSGFVGLNYRQCFVSEFAGQGWAMRHGCK